MEKEPKLKMNVGDLNSSERGTGARANEGKPRMDLIPLSTTLKCISAGALVHGGRVSCLHYVSLFEKGDDAALDTALHHLTPDCLRDAARVFEYGAEKYAAWNWAKGMPWSVPLGCIGRHVLALGDGCLVDEESEQSHWGHIVCNIIMLAHYVEYYPEGDDRPPAELFQISPLNDPSYPAV